MALSSSASKSVLAALADLLSVRAGDLNLTALSTSLSNLSGEISAASDDEFYYEQETSSIGGAGAVWASIIQSTEQTISSIVLNQIKDEVVTIDDHLDRIQSTVIDAGEGSMAGPTFRNIENSIGSDSAWDTLMKAVVIHSLKKSGSLDEVEAEVPNVSDYT